MMNFIKFLVLSALVAFSASASAQDRKLICFEDVRVVHKNDKPISETLFDSSIYDSLSRVTSSAQFRAANDTSIPKVGDCAWVPLPSYGSYKTSWVGFSEQNELIVPVWEAIYYTDGRLRYVADVVSYKTSEYSLYRDWKNCSKQKLIEFGGCVVPRNCSVARGLQNFIESLEGIDYPPYIELRGTCIQRGGYGNDYDDHHHHHYDDRRPYRR